MKKETRDILVLATAKVIAEKSRKNSQGDRIYLEELGEIAAWVDNNFRNPAKALEVCPFG